MKRIILFLLSIIVVMFPSCDEGIKQSNPANPIEKTEIALFVDGEELKYERNRYDNYVFMDQLSMEKSSDTVTITIKNVGQYPAHIHFNHNELESCTVMSSLPEVMEPGQSSEIKFTFTVSADKGVLPDSNIGNISFGGNFDSRVITFKGTKVDVPILMVNPRIDTVFPYRANLGAEDMQPQTLMIFDYKAGRNNELIFGYSFYNSPECYSSIDSIEVVGIDSEYFSLSRKTDKSFALSFNPGEIRKYAATVRFHILSSDFKEYVRDLPFIIDVVSINNSFFFNDEFNFSGYANTESFTIAAGSDGHAYIYAVQDGKEGFIEINEKDEYVGWKGMESSTHMGYPIESWFDEVHRAVIVLRDCTKLRDVPPFLLDIYDFVNGYQSIALELDKNESYKYVCQSPDYLFFVSESYVTVYDKKNFKLIDTMVTGSFNIRDMIYDGNIDSLVIAYDNSIWITQFDRNTGVAEGRLLELGSQCKGAIRKILKVPEGFYVLNEYGQIYLVKVNDKDFSVELQAELKGYKPETLYYANKHLYFTVNESFKVYAFDFVSNKVVPIFELPNPYDYETRYQMIERNGNLYCTTTIRVDPFDPVVKQGYIKRIRLV